MFYRPWQINRPSDEISNKLQNNFGLPQLVCDVLSTREKHSNKDVGDILNDTLEMPDPMKMSGMQDAVDRILAAVDSGENIVVFGDYDVDGVTATALLYSYLDSIGANVFYVLPSREGDGYGLFPSAVEKLSAKNINLIITVDNGITANEAVDRANELGIDVVITDHHLPPEVLPAAVAVVDPRIPGDESGCENMCGAGVAYMLVCALECCEAHEMLTYYADLAAIGTIADIMVLEGVNRTIVKAGLELLNSTDRPGLVALFEICGLADKKITAESISYAVSPRLNAAGRMDSATTSFLLLLCEEQAEAMQLAKELDDQNTERQKTEQEISKQVISAIEADPNYKKDRILVVAKEGYHPGIIGIVASRVCERYGKPSIIISIDENGEGKGSGRSVAGISLYNAISHCEDLLLRFGGHSLAAGLSINAQDIPALRKKVNEWAMENHPSVRYAPLVLDAEIDIGTLTTQDVNSLNVLEPFGHGNRAPLFFAKSLLVEDVYAISEGKHSRLKLRSGNASIYAVLFGQGPCGLCYKKGDMVDAALSISVYESKNGEIVSARIKELRPAGIDEAFLDGVEAFELFCNEADLSDKMIKDITPTREDTGYVYRAIKDGVTKDDLRPLFKKLGERNTGKTLVSLAALCELELVGCKKDDGGCERYVFTDVDGKKNLSDAPILQKLSAAVNGASGG